VREHCRSHKAGALPEHKEKYGAFYDGFAFRAASFHPQLEGLQRPTRKRDIEAFELATYEDLKIAVDVIQREQSQRQGLRNLNKLRPLLEFLRQYSLVIEQFVTAKADFLAFIWVGVCLFMLNTTRSLPVQRVL